MTWKFSSKTRKFWSRTSKLSKAGVLKRCKENKITAPPNDWRNIPFCLNSFKNNYHRIKSSQSLIIMVLIEHLESWKYKTDEIQTSPFNLGIRKKLNQIKNSSCEVWIFRDIHSLASLFIRRQWVFIQWHSVWNENKSSWISTYPKFRSHIQNNKDFCVTLIDFLLIIKQIPQFLIRENSFLRVRGGERDT